MCNCMQKNVMLYEMIYRCQQLRLGINLLNMRDQSAQKSRILSVDHMHYLPTDVRLPLAEESH